MTKWIELREKIRKIYGKHNRLILAVVKFILALFLFLLINHYVGYMEKLHHVYIAVALALICAMLPVNMTVLLAAVFTVVHLYGSCSDSTFDIPVDVFSVFSVFTEKRI